jgi:hypothetical protein
MMEERKKRTNWSTLTEEELGEYEKVFLRPEGAPEPSKLEMEKLNPIMGKLFRGCFACKPGMAYGIVTIDRLKSAQVQVTPRVFCNVRDSYVRTFDGENPEDCKFRNHVIAKKMRGKSQK